MGDVVSPSTGAESLPNRQNTKVFCHPKRSKTAMSRIRGFAQSKGSSFIKVSAQPTAFFIDWIATSLSFGFALTSPTKFCNFVGPDARKLNSFARNDKLPRLATSLQSTPSFLLRKKRRGMSGIIIIHQPQSRLCDSRDGCTLKKPPIRAVFF